MALSNAMTKIQLFTVHIVILYSLLGLVQSKILKAKPEIQMVKYEEFMVDHMVCEEAPWKRPKCTPHETYVKLKPKAGYSYSPNAVLTMSCSGYCGMYHTCMPTREKIREVPIKVIDNAMSNITYCYNIAVYEHTACKCMCRESEEDCNNELKKYDNSTCKCTCRDEEAKSKCVKQENMEWEEETCTCRCNKPKEVCSTGFFWIVEECRCMQMMI